MNTTRSSKKSRAHWLKTLHQWHWISAALCLIGMILLAFTGITLNHAAQIEAKPVVETHEAQLPTELLAQLTAFRQPNAPLPQSAADWLEDHLPVNLSARAAEWSEDEIYLALPRPGGDAWITIDRHSGAVRHEDTRRGWISYLNDLHKGRNAGPVWGWFLDLLAVATLIFSITGLLLLKLHAPHRPTTWPMVALGLILPWLLALFFIH